MPMIDLYTTEGTFADRGSLAQRLAETLMRIEQVPALPLFRNNTAAFVHALPEGAIANVEGESGYVRVQVLTNLGALNRAKQLAVVEQLTDLLAIGALTDVTCDRGSPAESPRARTPCRLIAESAPSRWTGLVAAAKIRGWTQRRRSLLIARHQPS